MFRKKPYTGWLIIAFLLWGIAMYFNWQQHAALRPSAMAKAVQEQQQSRDEDAAAFLKDTALIRKILHNKLSGEEFISAKNHHFYVFAYQQDSLVFWNDDDLLALPEHVQDTTGHLAFVNNQYGIRKTYIYPQRDGRLFSIALFYTIKVAYSYENQYLQSNFSHLHYIPNTTEVLNKKEAGAYPVKNTQGHIWCYLKFPENAESQIIPEYTTLIAAFFATIIFLLWLQLIILDISRRKSWKKGLLLTISLVLALRLLLKFIPLPFNIGELTIMSPVIYAYNWLLPSLGDLLLHEIALLWIIVFIVAETPYKTYWAKLRIKPLRYIAAALVLCCFPLVLYQFYIVLQSLVLDSQISFDVSHFHTIDGYTIVGLMAMGLGLIIMEMTVRLLCGQLSQLITRFVIRLVLIPVVAVLFVWIFHRSETMIYVLVVWMCIYLLLLQVHRNRVVSILSLQMIFLSLFTCASVSIIIHDLVQSRDLSKDRIAYAQHLLARQDPLMEFNFKSIAPRLQQDDGVLQYLADPSKKNKAALVRRLNLIYFNKQADRYLTEYYIFNPSGNGLYNIDSTNLAQLNARFEQGMPTEDEQLVFTEGTDNNNYLARIPLNYGAGQKNGFLYIVLTLKKSINETVYPELLQPATVNRIEKNARYSYALYLKGKRITQTSDYNFPGQIDTTGKVNTVQIRKVKNGFYEISYEETPGSVAIIAGSTGSWLSTLMILSYLFGVHLLLSLIALIYQWAFRVLMQDVGIIYHFTLQQRIHFGTLIILLVSFIIVGIVTVAFFRDRYIGSTRDRMYRTTEGVERTVRQYLASAGGMNSFASLDSITRTADFRYMLYNLAAGQKIDANVFAYSGGLILGSQEDLYEQGLLAPVMRPTAYRNLRAGSSIEEEGTYVCYFPFYTCYMPLRNDEGNTLGFISVPFFSSFQELNDQISNIVVALINLYAVLFFLSSFLAWFISTRLTHTFNVLIKQFGRLNLQKNELLEWPYEDEIGLLVKEYNKMAIKVEENAAMMAQNEREDAWREMARQVAHEIKNPLTPMKLNIQYLQQALKSKRPDVEVLAARVSIAIIEQIDNLSYIASEFSNFAKMPEAKPEIFSLNEFVLKAIPLYQGEGKLRVSVEMPETPMMVLADYSQLLRVFTNLMQNATQAIPEDRDGKISVVLSLEEGNALLSVTDNGSGIDEEAATKIFKPYFTTKSSGTGLGLAMSRKIIELWKGTIWFESVPGEGTTFFIRMPLEKDAG